jgi:hypothetical protein
MKSVPDPPDPELTIIVPVEVLELGSPDTASHRYLYSPLYWLLASSGGRFESLGLQDLHDPAEGLAWHTSGRQSNLSM